MPFIAAVVLGCTRADDGEPTNWSSLQLQGKTLDLVDDTKVETYNFSAEGLFIATVGTKGGPVAGPLYYWQIRDKVLVISESPDLRGSIEELTDPKVHGAVVSADRKSGDRVEYTLASTNG